MSKSDRKFGCLCFLILTPLVLLANKWYTQWQSRFNSSTPAPIPISELPTPPTLPGIDPLLAVVLFGLAVTFLAFIAAAVIDAIRCPNQDDDDIPFTQEPNPIKINVITWKDEIMNHQPNPRKTRLLP